MNCRVPYSHHNANLKYLLHTTLHSGVPKELRSVLESNKSLYNNGSCKWQFYGNIRIYDKQFRAYGTVISFRRSVGKKQIYARCKNRFETVYSK